MGLIEFHGFPLLFFLLRFSHFFIFFLSFSLFFNFFLNLSFPFYFFLLRFSLYFLDLSFHFFFFLLRFSLFFCHLHSFGTIFFRRSLLPQLLFLPYDILCSFGRRRILII